MGKMMPLPANDQDNQPHVDSNVVETFVDHQRGPGRPSVYNYFYRRQLRDFGPTPDLYRRVHSIPPCRDIVSASHPDHGLISRRIIVFNWTFHKP